MSYAKLRTPLAALWIAACATTIPTPPPSDPVPVAAVRELPAGLRYVTSAVTPAERSSGVAAVPAPVVLATAEGRATYYAARFDGRRTASGIVFSNDEMYAAHRDYPFGTVLRVTNLRNDSTVVVRVVDRGPNGASARARGLIIDVSRRAAEALDFVRAGHTPIRIDVLSWGEGS